MLAMLTFLAASAITPAHHQQAATALYQVLTSYNAEGLFQGIANEEGSVPRSEHSDGVLTIGSAFAVSRDGWLMTAGHVMDPNRRLSDVCERLSISWHGSVMLRRATLTTVLKDIAGNTYGIVASLEPATAGENLCIPGVRHIVRYDETTIARIVAFDTNADLALLKLDVASIMHLPLASKAPHRWADLFAVGYTDPDIRTTVSGSVARQCEETEGECIALTNGATMCVMVKVMRTTAAVQEGMSGSPQIVDGAVVGITTMKALDAPIGFAVPSTYAVRWYRHVRWPTKYPRPRTVCEPTPEP